MPTGKPRVTITMTEEEYQKIETYRFETRQKNQTQAVLSLIRAGLESLNKETPSGPEEPKSEVEKQFMGLFGQLSDQNQRFLLAVIQVLLGRGK